MHEAVVIGSGPAGISVAKGLLERGLSVTLIDAGKTLEPSKQAFLDNVQKTNQFLNTENYFRFPTSRKKNLKLPYASHFIYEDVDKFFNFHAEDCHVAASFARGGLSNTWGGVVAEYPPESLANWPAPCRDLTPYYRDIIAWLGNFYASNDSTCQSQQASYLFNKWQQNQTQLSEAGVNFHTTTLAVNFNRCHYCGLCQYGCPYGLIYHSSIHLEQLKTKANFIYIKDLVLENFTERKTDIELQLTHIQKLEKQFLLCKHLFIACGAGLSSLLYLRAMNEPETSLFLKDSQHFILPCLMDKPIKQVVNERLHALCQLALTLHHASIMPQPIYLQLYTYMDLYQQGIKNYCKKFYPLLAPFFAQLYNRLVILQGYLHPQVSNIIKISYRKKEPCFVSISKNNNSAQSINQAVNLLKQQKNLLGFRPYPLLLAKSEAGESNHLISSLSMCQNPTGHQTDIWGKPSKLKRVHFVDGSILPDLPAGPITLTIMANAYRIGKECPL